MYDAIIIGARCGGSPLAMLLARAGLNVLLVDRMRFGSDIVSTHFLKRTGASLLQKWGLLDAIRGLQTPEIRKLTFNLDGVSMNGVAPAYDGVDAEFTPRRFYLDKILVDAAIEAGAEAREKFHVNKLIFDDNRVVGIVGKDENGRTVTERARIVVGADGINSFVAKEVKAGFFIDAGTYNSGFYAYYSGMPGRRDAVTLYVRSQQRLAYITFPTNDALDVVFLFWPSAEADIVRADLEKAFGNSLRAVPELETRVSAANRESPFAGTHRLANFFRFAHGPGWALVGDAALHRDPITAEGISNAFCHAEILADELIRAFDEHSSTLDEAAASYDRRQFKRLKPMFDYTVHQAMIRPATPQSLTRFSQAAADPDLSNRFLGAFIGSVPLDVAFKDEVLQGFAARVQQANDKQQGRKLKTP